VFQQGNRTPWARVRGGPLFRARIGGCHALVFDLDGTLVDSVYQHVAAWSDGLRSEGILAPNWKIHRHVGMSGGSFLRKLLREISAPPQKHLD
jgi:beta-phosphoglucomutase-like phosphatase (HAD superfamily)